MSDRTLWLFDSIRLFFFFNHSSVHSCHLFLISSWFLAISVLYHAHIAWNVPLVSIIFLKRSLVFPGLFLFFFFFFPIPLHCSLKKLFLYLLAIFWKYAFLWVYLSFSSLPFTFLLFADICKAYSDTNFAFLHFVFLGMVLDITFCGINLRL